MGTSHATAALEGGKLFGTCYSCSLGAGRQQHKGSGELLEGRPNNYFVLFFYFFSNKLKGVLLTTEVLHFELMRTTFSPWLYLGID